MRIITGRALHLMMGLYLAASAIVIVDDAGLSGEDSALAAAAEAMRESRSGSDSFGLVEGFDAALGAVRKLAGAFDDVGTALE